MFIDNPLTEVLLQGIIIFLKYIGQRYVHRLCGAKHAIYIIKKNVSEDFTKWKMERPHRYRRETTEKHQEFRSVRVQETSVKYRS